MTLQDWADSQSWKLKGLRVQEGILSAKVVKFWKFHPEYVVVPKNVEVTGKDLKRYLPVENATKENYR